jgi:N-acetylneuraminic acid mutarotase
MSNARYHHTASILTNGKVLIAGGWNYNVVLDSAELYNSSTGAWTMTSDMHIARRGHTASTLTNEQVLVTGGFNSISLNSAELYDPSTDTWTTTGNMNIA